MSARTCDLSFSIADIAALLNLKVRHQNARSMDVDCPFCSKRGKMNLNFEKNVFRCNYCGESGGMIALYAKTYSIDSQDAYREICDSLKTGDRFREAAVYKPLPAPPSNAQLASPEEIHQTYSMLLSMLTLSNIHRQKLRERGLTDEQTDKFGYKSVPAYGYVSLTERLVQKGCTVSGVPGFYINNYGQWSVKFHAKASGILIPVISIGGRISGVQIRLDNPVDGRKYFWLSSANDNMGVTSGSPVHFVGDPTSKVVYITEGPLKADIAHCLCGKTFAAVAGVNQHTRLNTVFQVLKQNGTQEIVEAYDMDKFQNEHVQKGCERLYELAAEHGFKVTRLKWDTKYKGIDDWQLSVNSKPIIKKIQNMAKQKYRVYQVVLENKEKCPAFAFQGLSVWHECGYTQPPAALYELVYDSSTPCGENDSDMVVLEQIFELLNVDHPSDYRGRSLSISDVVELYDDNVRRYYYCESAGFTQVQFSPALAKQKAQ